MSGTSSSPSFARAERNAIADLALAVGGDAPTLCGDWTVKDLLVHLLIRERNPLAQAGDLLSPLAGLYRRAWERWHREDLPLLADQFRRPLLTWARIPAADRLVNTGEYFVHHEDIRRAQPGWEPRGLSGSDTDTLWRLLRPLGALATRKVGAPVVAVDARTGERAVIRKGEGPAVVSGEPGEVLLHLLGRTQTRGVEVTGPDLAVRRLAIATLGF